MRTLKETRNLIKEYKNILNNLRAQLTQCATSEKSGLLLAINECNASLVDLYTELFGE